MRSQIHHLLAESAAARGDASALTFKDVTVTYAQLWREVADFAVGLSALGVRRGDRVAVYLDKRIETVAAVFGASASGGVFVPVNPLLKPRQVGYILQDCDVRVLVTSPERLAPSWGGARSSASPSNTWCSWDNAPLPLDPGGQYHYIVNPWPVATEDGPVFPLVLLTTDMAAILYTSGSTGQPKGVVLSHRNLIVGAESVSHYLGNTPDDVILSALPFSFDAGFSQLTTAFSVGAHVVLLNYLLPADVVRLCAPAPRDRADRRPAAVDPDRRPGLAAEAAEHLRYFANTGRQDAQGDARQAAVACSGGRAIPHVRADRGVPLHLSRPGGGRPATRFDRQGHSQRRDPRRSSGRFALRPWRGGRAGPPRRARGHGILERPGTHRRALPPRSGA